MIFYRPDVATILNKTADFMIDFYQKDPRIEYFNLCAARLQTEGDTETSALFRKAADALTECNNHYFNDYCYEQYAEAISVLRGATGIYSFTKSECAAAIYPIYEKLLNKEIRDTLLNDASYSFTKSERYTIQNVLDKITSQLRNPNIQRKDGEPCAYYDKPYSECGSIFSFEEAVKRTIEFIDTEVRQQIDFFNIPDEAEKLEPELER